MNPTQDYTNLGYDITLTKSDNLQEVQEFDPLQIDQLIPELSGSKIVDYASTNFNFIPTTPQANPNQGDLYYDKTDRKLRVYTGSSYETVTST